MTPSRFLPLRRSARASLLCAAATAVFAVLTAWQLEEWLGALTLVALGGFVLSALYAILGMNRYWVAAGAAATTATTIGCTLAFLRVLGLAWDDAPDSVTTVSSRDADPYFLGAVVAALATLAILFAGAAWPRRRKAAKRPIPRPAGRATPGPRPSSPRPGGAATATARTNSQRPAKPSTPKAGAPKASSSGASVRASGSRPAARRNG